MNREEVWKRRTKASSSQLNVYQKAVLMAGAVFLFLTIGLSVQWPSLLFLAVGIPGGTLLVFLLFKNLRPWNKGGNKSVMQGSFSRGEEAFQAKPVSSRADRIAEPLEAKSERTSSETLRESILSAPEEAITIPETLSIEKEDWNPTEVVSGDGVLAQIQERLSTMEERVSNLGSRLLSLEGKLAEIQETHSKSAPPIDLQTILTNLEKQNGKIEQ